MRACCGTIIDGNKVLRLVRGELKQLPLKLNEGGVKCTAFPYLPVVPEGFDSLLLLNGQTLELSAPEVPYNFTLLDACLSHDHTVWVQYSTVYFYSKSALKRVDVPKQIQVEKFRGFLPFGALFTGKYEGKRVAVVIAREGMYALPLRTDKADAVPSPSGNIAVLIPRSQEMLVAVYKAMQRTAVLLYEQTAPKIAQYRVVFGDEDDLLIVGEGWSNVAYYVSESGVKKLNVSGEVVLTRGTAVLKSGSSYKVLKLS